MMRLRTPWSSCSLCFLIFCLRANWGLQCAYSARGTTYRRCSRDSEGIFLQSQLEMTLRGNKYGDHDSEQKYEKRRGAGDEKEAGNADLEGKEGGEDEVTYIEPEELMEFWVSEGNSRYEFDESRAINAFMQSQFTDENMDVDMVTGIDEGVDLILDPTLRDGKKLETLGGILSGDSKNILRRLLTDTNKNENDGLDSQIAEFFDKENEQESHDQVDADNGNLSAAQSVGIDLGTSNSAISYIHNGKPTVISIDGARTVPSAVCYQEDGSLLVGKAASNRRLTDPLNTFLSVKRVMGKTWKELPKVKPYQMKQNETHPLEWKIKVHCRNHYLKPEEISAEVLKFLLAKANRSIFHGSDRIKRAVITVPAYFTEAQRAATERAGILAGLEKVKLIREPEAAAFAYGLTQRERQIVLVFDLGGGTFDVSILDVGDGFAEVIATSGDPQLGGDDFDAVIVNWMIEQFLRNSEARSPRKDPEAMSRLYTTAEKTKITLSKDNVCTIHLHSLLDGIDLQCELTRDKFDALTAKLLAKLLVPMREAALMAGINLAGESLSTDEALMEIDEMCAEDEAAEIVNISVLKRRQQMGRRTAKMRKKAKADLGRELNRLKSKLGDNTISPFPGGYALNDVILVGGATRIPSVQRAIQGLTGITPRLTVNPDEAVSLGAAILAGTLDGTVENMQVMSSWQAALYRAFYDDYYKEQKENKKQEKSVENNTNTMHQVKYFEDELTPQVKISEKCGQSENNNLMRNDGRGEMKVHTGSDKMSVKKSVVKPVKRSSSNRIFGRFRKKEEGS